MICDLILLRPQLRPGAIIAGGKGTAAEKMAAMTKAGIHVVNSPADIGETVVKALAN